MIFERITDDKLDLMTRRLGRVPIRGLIVFGARQDGLSYVVSKDNNYPTLGWTASVKQIPKNPRKRGRSFQIGLFASHASQEVAQKACEEFAAAYAESRSIDEAAHRINVKRKFLI